MVEFVVSGDWLRMELSPGEKILARCVRSPKIRVADVERVFYTDRAWSDVLQRGEKSRWSRPINVSWATNRGLEIPTYRWLLVSVRSHSNRGRSALVIRGDRPAVCIDLRLGVNGWGFFAASFPDSRAVARALQRAIHESG